RGGRGRRFGSSRTVRPLASALRRRSTRRLRRAPRHVMSHERANLVHRQLVLFIVAYDTPRQFAAQLVASRTMKVGLQIPSFSWPGGAAEIGPTLARVAHQADDVGFDSIWV